MVTAEWTFRFRQPRQQTNEILNQTPRRAAGSTGLVFTAISVVKFRPDLAEIRDLHHFFLKAASQAKLLPPPVADQSRSKSQFGHSWL
jgi:hypothetical protein